MRRDHLNILNKPRVIRSPHDFDFIAASRERLAAISRERGEDSPEAAEEQRRMAVEFVDALTLLAHEWKRIRLMGSATGTITAELSRSHGLIHAKHLRGLMALRWRLLPTFPLQWAFAALCHAPWLLPRIIGRAIMPKAVQMTLWVIGNQRRQLRQAETAYTGPAGRQVPRVVVDMHTGSISVGGLIDRIRGLVSAYLVCRETGREFRIHFTHPFRLDDYLAPAAYDWRISDADVSFSLTDTARVITFAGLDNAPMRRSHHWRMARAFRRNRNRQTHVYSNSALCYGSDFGALFRELFRPVPRLESDIRRATDALGAGYVSVSARFLNLLGDFNEEYYSLSITAERRRQLLEACLEVLSGIHRRFPKSRLLVCSDSTTFLGRATRLPYVAVIPGTTTHIANDTPHTWEYYEKTFLDFYCISRASHSLLLLAPGMYPSGFPYAAARVGGRELETLPVDLP